MMLSMAFLFVLIFIVRAEDPRLGWVQKNETVLYWDPKCPITAGTPLANLAPVKAEARNKTDPNYALLTEASKKKIMIRKYSLLCW